MNKAELIDVIRKAFDGVPAPEDYGLADAENRDSYTLNDIPQIFDGPWQDLPGHDIAACPHALSYVDPVGMRYFLPAYLVWCLKNFGSAHSISFDQTLYALDPHSDDPGLSDRHSEIFSLFNDKQTEACALFVLFCAEDETDTADREFAIRIYKQFWKQFTPVLD